MRNIQFINAGAGSGKTFRLTHLLAEHVRKGKCRGNQVIMTTFSIDAAAELRSRAREVLMKKGMDTDANLLSSAAIGTVHSVALQMIKKYWYHLGLPVDMGVMTEEDVDFYFNQALAEIPDDEELKILHRAARQFNFVDNYHSVNYNAWKQHLKGIIDLAVSYRIDDLEASKQASLETAVSIFQARNFQFDEQDIKQMLDRLRELFLQDKVTGASRERIINLDSIREKSNWELPEFSEALKVFKSATKGHRKVLPAIDDYQERLQQVWYSTNFREPYSEYIMLIFDLAVRSLETFREFKKESRIVDYNDMESLFLRLLEFSDVRKEIGSTYKHVYVDEFQDSSPIQFEIFRQLSDIVDHSYWVGDPKQAIYGFRGTSPELIRAVVERFMNGDNDLDIANLGHSWRSRPGIVETCNAIFTPALRDQVRDEQYIKLESIRKDNELNESDQPPVQHWHMQDDHGNKGNKQQKWHHLAEQVSSLLGEGSWLVVDKDRSIYHPPGENRENQPVTRMLKPSDIAILCRKNESVSDVAANLRGFGLKVAGNQKGIRETAEYHLLLAAINYLKDESDQLARAILAILGGKYDAASELIDERLAFLYDENAPSRPSPGDEMEEERRKEMHKTWMEYLSQWPADLKLLPLIDKIRNAVAGSTVPMLIEQLVIAGGLYELVERWEQPEQRQANLQALVKKSVEYDEHCLTLNIGPSLEGFIHYLEELDENKFIQSAAKGEDAVNVLTYHRAKGLEWPVVILTELEDLQAREDNIISKSFFDISYENPGTIDPDHPFDGMVIRLVPWPFGSRQSNVPEEVTNQVKLTSLFQQLLTREQDESKRLLYVGFTRARDMLITTTYRKNEPEWYNHVRGESMSALNELNKLPENVYALDLFNINRKIPVRIMDFSSELEFPEKPDSVVAVLPRPEVLQKYPLKYISPSSMSPAEHAVVTTLQDFDQRIETGSISTGQEAELGNCLHDIYAAYSADIEAGAYLEIVKATIRNHGMHGNLAQPEHVQRAIVDLHAFLRSAYGEALNIYRELPLQSEDEGTIYRGEADLVWETEKGLVIVDYKSFPGRKDQVLRPGDEHFAGKYSGQLKKYKEMVEAGHPEQKKVIETLLYYSVSGLLVRVVSD